MTAIEAPRIREKVDRPPGLVRRLPTSGVAMVGLGLILFWVVLALLAPILPIAPPNTMK